MPNDILCHFNFFPGIRKG